MAGTSTPRLDVRHAGRRLTTRTGRLDSKHPFSFGRHYDRRNTHFGLLVVSNDNVVAPGTGFVDSAKNDAARILTPAPGSMEPVHLCLGQVRSDA